MARNGFSKLLILGWFFVFESHQVHQILILGSEIPVALPFAFCELLPCAETIPAAQVSISHGNGCLRSNSVRRCAIQQTKSEKEAVYVKKPRLPMLALGTRSPC